MESETMSARSLRSLLILVVCCGSLLSGAFTVVQDAWLATLLMGLVFLPLLLMYSRLCVLLPGKNIFDMIQVLFGRVGCFLLILLLTLYGIMVTGLMLRNFVEFTVVIALQDTPSIPLMIAIILPVLYLSAGGGYSFARWATIICVVILINVLMTILLSINIMQPSHMLPVMDHSWQEILSNAVAVGTIVVGETMMLLALMDKLPQGQNPYKVFLPGVFIGLGVFVLILLRNLLILGPEMVRAAKFSTYMAVRVIHIGTSFERIESSISFNLILLGITKMVLYLSASAMGTARLLKVQDYKKLLLPVALLCLASCVGAFKNVFEMYNLVYSYRYLALPFQMLIPFIVWITAEVKMRKKPVLKQG